MPDIKELLKQLKTNADAKNTLIEDYNYNQIIIRKGFNANGSLHEIGSSTYQISYYKGYQIKRLIEKDGKPLNEKEQKKADREAQKAVEDVEKMIAKKEKNQEDSGNFYSDVLKASNLLNPRRERFRGREVIVFDFEPNPEFDMKNASSILKFFGKVVGVMWVDEKDKEAVRVEAVLADNFKIGGGFVAKLNRGASFVFEQNRLNDEVWLPSLMEVNLSAKIFLLKGMNLNQTVKSYNFSKFKADVEGSGVEDVKKP